MVVATLSVWTIIFPAAVGWEWREVILTEAGKVIGAGEDVLLEAVGEPAIFRVGALEEEAREEHRDGGGSTYTEEAVGAGMARRRREEAIDDPMMMRGGEWFTRGEMEEERANREVQLQADIVLTHDRTAQARELAEVAREAIRQQEYLNANTYLDEAEALMQSVSRVIENELPLLYVDLQPGSNGFIMMQQLRES
uniref:Band 7 domain-containing protein n=1 Tax=Chromera velia CCMP2878 TaxID=1169474 RepID=A0A0G4F0V4_9ALVE|eukprot:Cvel_14390.t1-p1 / transcript=Cvel_14390.t1 / gene=Cvel_14390 / organism=Chromera_velia_CCMP2878 / gene_product=hypothetical protein / transcript_product=hypothetical protein / location=Cvel_scaffold1021:30226-31837(-) / protein_length=195 / sequence_SO=supercontig / SO=protein_coding / is_pseudo=false